MPEGSLFPRGFSYLRGGDYQMVRESCTREFTGSTFVMGNGLAAFNMFMISALVGSLRPFPVELPHL